MKTVKVKNIVIGEGIPKICMPIIGGTIEEIREEMKEILKEKPDLVEWRADSFKGVEDFGNIREPLKEISSTLDEIPLLFTIRTLKEGGKKDISFETYKRILLEVAKTKQVDLIDVEMFFCEEESKNLITELHREGVKIIASNHHFDRTPDVKELIYKMKKMDDVQADIIKMAVMPKSEKDLCPILEATMIIHDLCKKPIVTMSMGKDGVLSRLWGEFIGSAITFVSGQKASAPGRWI